MSNPEPLTPEAGRVFYKHPSDVKKWPEGSKEREIAAAKYELDSSRIAPYWNYSNDLERIPSYLSRAGFDMENNPEEGWAAIGVTDYKAEVCKAAVREALSMFVQYEDLRLFANHMAQCYFDMCELLGHSVTEVEAEGFVETYSWKESPELHKDDLQRLLAPLKASIAAHNITAETHPDFYDVIELIEHLETCETLQPRPEEHSLRFG